MLYKHVVLSERARIQEELNTLSCSQLALRITLLDVNIVQGHLYSLVLFVNSLLAAPECSCSPLLL